MPRSCPLWLLPALLDAQIFVFVLSCFRCVRGFKAARAPQPGVAILVPAVRFFLAPCIFIKVLPAHVQPSGFTRCTHAHAALLFRRADFCLCVGLVLGAPVDSRPPLLPSLELQS